MFRFFVCNVVSNLFLSLQCIEIMYSISYDGNAFNLLKKQCFLKMFWYDSLTHIPLMIWFVAISLYWYSRMICRDRNVQLHRQAKQLIQEKNSIYKATTSVVHRASYIWLARVAINKLLRWHIWESYDFHWRLSHSHGSKIAIKLH